MVKYGTIKIKNARLVHIGNLLKTISAWIDAPKDRVTTGISLARVSQIAGISTIYLMILDRKIRYCLWPGAPIQWVDHSLIQ